MMSRSPPRPIGEHYCIYYKERRGGERVNPPCLVNKWQGARAAPGIDHL